MGIETVAVFSEGDRGSKYLELADESYCVGNARSSDSYLRTTQLISAAELSGAEAIHPGYGFMGENADFNEACRDSNINFIGPTPDAMRMLGDKNTARSLARKADVPVVPGSAGLIEDTKEAMKVAKEIGYPVLVLWRRWRLPRKIRRTTSARRSPDFGGHARQRRSPLGTRLLNSATPSKTDRRKPRSNASAKSSQINL